MCDEFHSEHLPRNVARFVSTASEFHAATLTATARMNLRFHDHKLATEFFRRVISLLGRVRNDATRNRHTILS